MRGSISGTRRDEPTGTKKEIGEFVRREGLEPLVEKIQEDGATLAVVGLMEKGAAKVSLAYRFTTLATL
ncbi:hypothetical protein [Candidatus Nitrospira allomarina]|jgi:hypothetical protein|uniref:Uncharacterized protein n=1 Tax=Candidatus Nitrospira allomarina TaxID=3020900 RepID=A0AA96GFR7_9BACT|nr:hypothetical protein [Candidatus Nitrospira allomarina]WNM56951.1 hypothetical protein PP769_13315 [Candidatus Nitrospira allomarina]